jgi:hypothetical protein
LTLSSTALDSCCYSPTMPNQTNYLYTVKFTVIIFLRIDLLSVLNKENKKYEMLYL